MSNFIGYNTFNLFVNLRIERPYLYIIQSPWVLVLSVTSREKARLPHKFKLELECACLDSKDYENSFVNLNTKLLIPVNKFDLIAKKYRINLSPVHGCLNQTQLKELLIALETYWSSGKRKLITVILNN
jgi:hypothetical protein